MDNPRGFVLDKYHATNALTPAARGLQRTILAGFVATGLPPTRADLARTAHDRGIDPEAALSELAHSDVVVFDERGEICAAYPFSATPTPHRVTWDGGEAAVYALCAIDALGMSAMLGHPVRIYSTEPDASRAITIEVDGEKASWSPDTAVVFAGETGDTSCTSVDRACGHINFFTTPEAALNWAAHHPNITGVLLSQDYSLANGIAEFGTMLEPAQGR